MPIYEYKCKKCGHVFEVQQSFGDEPVKTCCKDGCDGRVQKVFSPPAIIFKGSGFYVNDHGRGNGNGRKNAAAAKADEAGETAKETAKDTSKETSKEASKAAAT